MKIYISGPISRGVTCTPQEIVVNKAKFTTETARLRALGHEVTNPCENPETPEATWESHMKVDIAQVCASDTLCLLPGWERSRGSRLEVFLALELGVNVLMADEL